MKKISTVIFDVDGTLLNTEQLWGEAWQMIADRYDCPSFRHDYVTGISGKQLEKVLKEHTPDIPDEQREKMLKEARETGMSLIREHVQALPGVMETLQELKKDGYRLAVATSTPRSLTMERLAKTDLLPWFEEMICGDEVSAKKPDPEIYEKIMAKMHVSAAETAVIEDTSFGVEAAWRAGCDVIMVPSVNPASQADRQRAVKTVSGMSPALAEIRTLYAPAGQ